MNEKDVAMQIGNFFGSYYEKDNQYCIDNGDQVFRYDSPKELLIDWLDTLVSHQHATKGDLSANWEKEIIYIYESVLEEWPAGVQPYRGRTGTSWRSSMDVSVIGEIDPHGKSLFLGTYPTIVDAITARKEFDQFQRKNQECDFQTLQVEANRICQEAVQMQKQEVERFPIRQDLGMHM